MDREHVNSQLWPQNASNMTILYHYNTVPCTLNTRDNRVQLTRAFVNVCQLHHLRRTDCPVSSLLFILAAEILATKIRSLSSIKGIEIGNKDKYVKLSQYADDGILFLNDKNELCSALNVLSDFGKVAGTVLNAGKCEGMWLGNVDTRHIRNDLFGIKGKSSVRCLGIYFDKDHHTNY